MVHYSVQYNGSELVMPLYSEEVIAKFPVIIQNQLRQLNKKAELEEKTEGILLTPHKIPYASTPDENKMSSINIK